MDNLMNTSVIGKRFNICRHTGDEINPKTWGLLPKKAGCSFRKPLQMGLGFAPGETNGFAIGQSPGSIAQHFRVPHR